MSGRIGFGHGKVILLGEHAVVHGQPALAGALGRGVRATAEPGPALLTVSPWDLRAQPGGEGSADRAFAAILAAVGVDAARVTAEAGLPVSAGLGSSAALAAAVARALCHDEERVAAAVDESERIFHGNPSGIDAALALRGGFGRFTRATGLQSIDAPPLRLCVGETGRPRDTRALVAGVAARLQAQPAETEARLRAIGELVEAGTEALKRGRLEELGALCDRNQQVLAELGVSSREIERLCDIARRHGALGAKLTGAGGGGCVIALAPGREDEVLEAWHVEGFDGFVAEVGT